MILRRRERWLFILLENSNDFKFKMEHGEKNTVKPKVKQNGNYKKISTYLKNFN